MTSASSTSEQPKIFEICTVPDILILHLIRCHNRKVLAVLVTFSIEGLDLCGRVGLNEGRSSVYDLFAVVNLKGDMSGHLIGHYTTFVQNFYRKKWYEYYVVYPQPPLPFRGVVSNMNE
jgi:ubiquitin C-terminal hydrolase